jgi:tetratricopeptide (TPR) repeat protein
MDQTTCLLGDSEIVELVTLAVKDRGVRCKVLATGEALTLKPKHGLWKEVPGQILSVRQNKLWNYAGTRYLSGEVLSARTAIESLNLVPLRLEDRYVWDPKDNYWGEPGEAIDPYQHAVIKAGPRPCFEMEQVIPGEDPEDLWEDPILEASEYYDCGDTESARKIMERILTTDLRCIDAHAHLGNWEFNRTPSKDPKWDESSVRVAMRHYEVGVGIGELSLSKDFKDALLWGMINNRPFLRCMKGYGLCHWRLGDLPSAKANFNRMIWLNPPDNQGIRFILAALDDNVSWADFQDSEN